MSINKAKQIRLETTAQYQPISDLNVRFFNQDINTSILDFIVTRNDNPIPLGIDNIEATIVLTSDKFKISDEVQIKDGLNGIVTYTLPKEILERPGKVTGQIYIGIKGKEDTVVQRLFSFDITDSLINSFDAETKLVYIKKFDKLEAEISQRVESIEQAIAHSEDYVTKVIEEKDIALSQIDASKINILEEMNNLADTRFQEIDTTGTQYINDLTTVRDGIDGKIDQFNSDVQAESYIKESDTANWQKSKMTQDNGYVQSVDTLDFNNFDTKINKTGFYYAKSVTNGPIGDYQTEGNVTLYKFENNKDRLTFQPRGTHKIFTKYKTGELNVWSEWRDLTYDMETTEGAQTKANIAENNAEVYTDEKIAATHKILFNGSVNGTGNIINLDENFYNYKMVVITGSWSSGTFYEVVIPEQLGSTINVQKFNLINSSGNLDTFYELTLSISSGIKITIDKDVSYDFSSGVGNGNRNSFTIAQIEGFN